MIIILFFAANFFITLNHRLFHGLVILVIRKRELQQSAIFRGTIRNISNNILHYNSCWGNLFKELQFEFILSKYENFSALADYIMHIVEGDKK